MRLLINFILLALIVCNVTSENENLWTWNLDDVNKPIDKPLDDLQAEASEIVEDKQETKPDETAIEGIVTDILTSTRQGRNLDGYDEVYTDPNLQDALQKGDDTEARNIIKEKLCHLGLMDVSLKTKMLSQNNRKFFHLVFG